MPASLLAIVLCPVELIDACAATLGWGQERENRKVKDSVIQFEHCRFRVAYG